MEELTMAVFLSLVANRLVEGIAKPVKMKFPNLDMWWLVYVSWVVGGVLAFLAGINLFAIYIPNATLAGQVLTALVVGGGANLIRDIFPKAPEVLLVTEEKDESHVI